MATSLALLPARPGAPCSAALWRCARRAARALARVGVAMLTQNISSVAGLGSTSVGIARLEDDKLAGMEEQFHVPTHLGAQGPTHASAAAHGCALLGPNIKLADSFDGRLGLRILGRSAGGIAPGTGTALLDAHYAEKFGTSDPVALRAAGEAHNEAIAARLGELCVPAARPCVHSLSLIAHFLHSPQAAHRARRHRQAVHSVEQGRLLHGQGGAAHVQAGEAGRHKGH